MASEDGPRMDGLPSGDPAVVRLEALSALVRAQQAAETQEVDPAFVLALRAHLTGAVERPPARFARRLRRRLIGPRRVVALGWAGAAAAAVLVLVFILGHRGASSSPVARGFPVPRPSAADLTRGFPRNGVGGGGGMISPLVSLADIEFGSAYAGRLHLAASVLPASRLTLTAHALAGPAFDGRRLAGLAHRLGIRASPTCRNARTYQPMPCSSGSWRVAASGVLPSRLPLHSLAVSLANGELIYHDLSYDRLSYHGSPLAHARAVLIARAWAREMGWPARRMPLLSVTVETMEGPANNGAPLVVSLGWAGVGRSNVADAVIWVAPTGRVVEARLWPPVTVGRVVDVVPVAAAWDRVRRGNVLVAVEGSTPYPPPAGSGILRSVSTEQLLVTPPDRRAYLVPVYRFAGTVNLGGVRHQWYALEPAA
ncbi:MAG TPA: hypothetical protein VFB58_13640 [Chloroflexota bacterium]|nr:hypothetical protein [Chloroflexota bacterium]